MNETDHPSHLDDRAAEIFERALELSAGERSAFLDEACSNNASLRAELQSLLRAHDSAASFLIDPQGSSRGARSASAGTLHDGVTDSIERYRIYESLGEGGFGVVYRAEQLEPIRRDVAIKVIKLGMDTRQVVARFEAERQALAMMDHPAIAKVFDAGATRSGRPYFAMELVEGQPIVRYCDDHRLSSTQRLVLFLQVCQAIQHAHQKGIIHRDIKPSNVLIANRDGMPLPKIIDFGIAKATHVEALARSVVTQQGQMIGTPAYMSPEQALSSGADIDTRSDIYSLGVLLYELLTGTTPFDMARIMGAGLDEMVRVIRDVEPARPSNRFSALGDTRFQVAQRRDTDVRRLHTTLRGDLDWVVMKCLEKDRTRRYATVDALAEDIQRHLDHEPVLARPPSSFYRLRKFTRRHRAAVGAGASIALALVLATLVSIRFAVREAQQRRRADHQVAESQAARQLAEARAIETKQVADFQASMLGQLDAAKVGRGINDHFREAFRSALERGALGDGPENRSERSPDEVAFEVSKFNSVIGAIPEADVARRVLDEFLLTSAARTAEERFGNQPLVRAQILDSLAEAYRALGLYSQAEAQSRTALSLRKEVLGPDDEAITANLTSLTWLLLDQDKYAEAAILCREALAIERRRGGDQRLSLAAPLHNLASTMRKPEESAEAEMLFREAIAIRREYLGNDHLDVADTINSLALHLQRRGDYAAAEGLFREALLIRRRLLGNRHAILAGALNNLANVVKVLGKREEAQALLREALEMRRALLGSEHPDVAQSLHNLGLFFNTNGEYQQAEPLFREAVAIWRKTFPDGHPDTASALLAWGVSLRGVKRYAEAESLVRESLAMKRKTLGDKDTSIAFCLNTLAGLLYDQGHYDASEEMFRDVSAKYDDLLTPSNRQWARLGLAMTLVKHAGALIHDPGECEKRLAEAEALLLGVNEVYSRSTSPAPAPVMIQRCFESLVDLYELRQKMEPDRDHETQAAQWRARLDEHKAATIR